MLKDVEQIDAYVEGRLRGELLVLDGMERENGERVLRGHIYNSSRTERLPIDFPLISEMREAA